MIAHTARLPVPSVGARRWAIDLPIVVVLYAALCTMQTWTLAEVAAPNTDEGVYLYAAKLIAQGYVPFKDFMTSHSPLVIYCIAGFYKVFGIHIHALRICHVLICESAVVPIYFLARRISQSRLAAVLCVVFFATYITFQDHDARFVALRQLATASLAWGLLAFFHSFPLCLEGRGQGEGRRWPWRAIAGFFIGLTVAITLGLGPLALAVVVGLVACRLGKRGLVREFIPVVAGMAPAGLFLLLVLRIPHAWHCMVEYNAKLHPWLPWSGRLELLAAWIKQDGLLIWFGVAGCLLWRSRPAVAFAVANIVGWALILASGPSLYMHHFAPLGVTMAVSFATLWNWGTIGPGLEMLRRLMLGAAFVAALLLQFRPHLEPELLGRRTPGYFAVVNAIRAQPGKLFTIEPIFAVDSGKDIPMHYYAADVRYLRELKQNLPEDEYIRLIDQANVVLVENFANYFLPDRVYAYVRAHYDVAFHNEGGYVFVRKREDATTPALGRSAPAAEPVLAAVGH